MDILDKSSPEDEGVEALIAGVAEMRIGPGVEDNLGTGGTLRSREESETPAFSQSVRILEFTL